MAKALHNAQNESKAMFACYFLGGAFSLMSLIIGSSCPKPLPQTSHSLSLPPSLADWISILFSRNYILTSIFSFTSALFAIAAASVSTHLFVKFWSWLDTTPDLTIHSQLGSKMYACVWIAVIFSWAAFGFHVKVALLPASGKPGWKLPTPTDREDNGIEVEEWNRKV